jgi:hypothetical protein
MFCVLNLTARMDTQLLICSMLTDSALVGRDKKLKVNSLSFHYLKKYVRED